MKQSPQTNPLDIFLREKLKSSDGKSPSVNWSEMEVVLGAEQKPITIGIGKKQIIIASGVVMLAIGIFFTVRYIRSFEEFHEETTSASDTVTTIQSYVADSQIITVAMPPPVSDDTITKVDTTSVAEKTIAATDTTPSLIKEKPIAVVQKIAVKETKKIEKKNAKLSSLAPSVGDADNVPENILPPDTSGNKISPEIKITPDTSKNSSPPKNSKPKKGKSKKGAATDSVKVQKAETPATKSDTLK